MISAEYRFVVRGLPQPKGSMRGFPFRGKDGRQRVALTSTTVGLKSWEDLIRFQVQDFEGLPWDGPIGIELHFYLPRPKSAPRRVLFPTTRPDGSKLLRSVEDALTGVVIRDDALIVRWVMSKDFATEFVGVEGRVWRVTEARSTYAIGYAQALELLA